MKAGKWEQKGPSAAPDCAGRKAWVGSGQSLRGGSEQMKSLAEALSEGTQWPAGFLASCLVYLLCAVSPSRPLFLGTVRISIRLWSSQLD